MELDIEKTEAPEEIEAWSWMSVAEEADVPLNGSKDMRLAVSASELVYMSSSGAKWEKGIGKWGRERWTWVFIKGE